jgi:uncharacterized membrane protein
MGSRVCAYAGTLLLASAVIFFFAYNWADLHRFAKIGLALAGVLASVTAAAYSRPTSTGWQAALFGASLCTGALLALIGQIYQTGADVWELFAAWTLLITPFALLARSAPTWLLWSVVANVAVSLALFFDIDLFGRAYDILFIPVGFNLFLLISLEQWSALLLARPSRYLHRLAALAAICPLAVAACSAWEDSAFVLLAYGFFVLAIAMLWFYNKIRTDLIMLAIAGFALVIVTTFGLAHFIFKANVGFITINLVALYLICMTGLLAVWLKGLYKINAASAAQQGEEA